MLDDFMCELTVEELGYFGLVSLSELLEIMEEEN